MSKFFPASGFAMAGRRMIAFLVLLIPLTGNGQSTLYTYQSGTWDNIDVWTTDPGGTTLTGSKVPGNGDNVVVLPSRTLSLNRNIDNTSLNISIQEGGVLDATVYSFSSVLASLGGKGIYRLQSSSFPSATVNTFVSAGSGTVEYYNCPDFNLPATQTSYNKLVINCPGFVATQVNNLTINSHLRVQGGTFRINDGTASRRTLIIKGDVTVNTGASLIVGAGNTTATTDPLSAVSGGTAPFLNYYISHSHRVEIFGSLINNGTVRFTNQAFPVFNAFPLDGFATVFFRGASDNSITCNGITDFYNLVVDKGNDQTPVLLVNSAGYDKFRLFGANVAGESAGSDAGNPDIRKALWIRNGSLKLDGYTFIPSLVEGAGSSSGDFIIPGNGSLIISGPEVVVMGSIDDYSVVNLAYGVNGGTGAVNGITTGNVMVPSSISLYGKLQINDGKLYIGELGRIVYFGSSPSAQFIINGGITDIKQFQSMLGGGKTAYWQTAGKLVLRGRFKRSLVYGNLTDLVGSIGNAGRLSLVRAKGPDPGAATLNIDQASNIFSMEGGDIEIYDVTTTASDTKALEINSDPANVNVTGGNITIYLTGGSIPAEDSGYGIATKAPLFNLSIVRNAGGQKAFLSTYPFLQILNDLTLTSTSDSLNPMLDAAGLDLRVGGDFTINEYAVYSPGDNRTVLNGSGSQTFAANGPITSGMHRLVIAKNSGTLTLGSNLTVRDSLIISAGTINDGGYSLRVAGNIYNAGVHTGTGKIVLNGNFLQTISASPNGFSVFGNMELRNATYPAGARLASDISLQSLSLTANTGGRSVFDILSYNLKVAAAITSAGSLGFGTDKMIITSGKSSDKGVSLNISLSGTYTNQLIATYPFGAGSSYNPAEIYCNGNPGTVSGTFTVVPVNNIHPATHPLNLSDALPFYWRTRSSGFSGLNATTINQWFCHASIVPPVNKAWYLTGAAWVAGSSASGGIAKFSATGFISADFTAGKNNPFRNPTTYYSRQSGPFNSRTTWSTDPVLQHTGAAATSDPASYDMMVIGGQTGALTPPRTRANDSVTVTATVNVASITINGSYTADKRTPVLNIQATTGHTINIIRGGGKFCTATSSIPVADYGEFLENESAVFHYYGASFTLAPSIDAYPNLMITGGNIKYLRDNNTIIRKDLIIADEINANNSLSLNNNRGDLIIYGNVYFKKGGKLLIPVTTSRTIDIYGNIEFTYGASNDVNAIEAISGAGYVHKINFYGRKINSGASNLIFSSSNANRIDLYLKNPGSVNITNGSGNFQLNRLFIQKNSISDTVFFRKNFTLDESGNGTALKSLNPVTGTLILSDPSNGSASSINLNLSSGGTNYFSINSNSRLILRNGSKINISGNTSGSGIRIDGLLKAEGSSEINFADGTAANTGYIEYSGSGNAVIDLSGSSILKAAQVRRSLSLATGLLNYRQSGSSSATIYGLGTAGIIDPSRAKFEVTGTGSSFGMSGTSTLTIINDGGTTYGDLYIRPGTSDITGGSIIFGTGVSGKSYIMNVSETLNNLFINSTGPANELKLTGNALVLNGDLGLNNAGSVFTTNDINVTIKGNFTNNGVFNAGSNTTAFNGSTQSITGANDPVFRNMLVSPTSKLILNRDITVDGSLTITSGILESSVYNLTVRGNVTNNGSMKNSPSPATSRLYLNGISTQQISGSGSFGRVELDNIMGARLANDLSLTENLTLSNGILDINQYSLTFGANSFITDAVFGPARMIKSDGVYSNGGIIKYFGTGYSGTFRYPAGVNGKYTPAVLTVNATNPGYVRVNPVNSRHPATLSPFNVLNYYWDIESALTGFDGNLVMNYSQTDVTGDESLFVAARLIIPPGTGWSKAAEGTLTDNVNETLHNVLFNFPAGSANLGGQYTVGVSSDLPNAIPVYTSNVTEGNWDTPESWTPLAPAGGPNGFAVVINAGNTIYTNGNRRFSFKTTINGTLDVGTSYGHNLGTVDGTGKLALAQSSLPAGDFKSFLGCSGGSLQYGGTGTYTIVADRIDTVRNMLFTGSGTRILPDKDLVICNQLQINGPVLENHFNRKLTIGGSFDLTAGSFLCGSGTGATVAFKGTIPQTVAGFNGSSPLNNIEINNSAGLTLTSPVEITGNLLLTNGIIKTTSANILKMINQSGLVNGGSSLSFISGPISKNIFGGTDFEFPVGKGNRFGKIKLINPQSGYWETEYFNNPFSDASVAGMLTKASTTEYWKITPPVTGNTTTLLLRWDDLSDINPLTTTSGINDIIMAEYNGADWIEKTSGLPAGNDAYGTVQTTGNIPVNAPGYYTLGSVSSVKPTITIGQSPAIMRCSGNTILPYTATSGNPDQYMIDFDATANTAGFPDVNWVALPASPVLITFPANINPGVYNATIRVRTSSPVNTSIPYSFTITISQVFRWTGTVGADWNNAGNWACGSVPPSGSSVYVSNMANKPVIGSGSPAYVNDLTIETGSSLTVSANTLGIAGTITNNGILMASTGKIEMNGTVAQFIGTNVFSGNTIRDLSVNNSAGVTLQGPLNVTGVLLLQNGNLASGGNLTLVSDATSTACIDGAGSGQVTGAVIMQRYLPSGFGYKYFSSPFQNATVSEFGQEMDLNASFPLFYAYDENRYYDIYALDPFYDFANPANIMTPMAGYSINFGANSTPLTVNATGIVNNGSFSASLFNHNQEFSLGRNLVGNPYPSAIDWNAPTGWTKTNIDNALYFFNASSTDQWDGIYSSYINGVSSDGIASSVIPSMQGFIVHVTDGAYPVSATLAMDNRVRINNLTQPFYRNSVPATEKSLLRLSASYTDESSVFDPLVIYLEEGATSGFDSRLDALKYFNINIKAPDFYSFDSEGKRLSINALPFPDGALPAIPLGLKIKRSGEVVFSLRDVEGPYSWGTVNLYDAFTGETHDLVTGKVYKVFLQAGIYTDRFYLNFNENKSEFHANEPSSDYFTVYSAHGMVVAEINCLKAHEGILTIENLTGQKVYNTKIFENGRHEFDPGLKNGIYVVSLSDGNFRFSRKVIIQNQ